MSWTSTFDATKKSLHLPFPGHLGEFVDCSHDHCRKQSINFLVDNNDGEDWTSLYHPATTSRILIADYVLEGGTITSTNVISLRR